MKKKVSKSLLAIAIAMTAMLFSACDTLLDSLSGLTGGVLGDVLGGEVPVYQGMSISSAEKANAVSAMSYSNGVMLLGSENGNKDNNGNHNGWYKGDSTDEKEEVDQENPFPDNAENENIETEIKDSFEVVGAGSTIYYATMGDDIFINIHIKNPDDFEIQSFTLNGKKYASYMFEKGSTMENIILKYNVGMVSGIQEYTIDAIKYIDGTQIKDVKIGGDKTVKAGIACDNQVTANPSNVAIGTNSLSFDVTISDDDGLISYSNGAVKAVLYDGETLVATKDLSVGDNAVIFDGLTTKTLYQYAVVGYYDNFKGAGFGMNLLYKDAFYMESVVLFDNITVGYDSIEFNFAWHENFANKTLQTLTLYQGETLVQTLAVDETSINGLLSGKEYNLIAEYKNGEATESIYLEFTTRARSTPKISIENVTRTQTSISFEIAETDEDNVGEITKIELLHGEDAPIVAESLDVREFTGLLSNNEYTVKVTYLYNLNDGLGDEELIVTYTIYTLYAETPLTYALYTGGISYYSVTSCDKSATSVTIEAHVEGIPVTTIGDSVFLYCNKLTNITIPDSITSIGEQAFGTCVSLTSVYYQGDIASWCNISFDGVYANPLWSANNLHLNNELITELIIPDSVTSIGDYAFYGCSSLTSITIPNSVTLIGEKAFSNCNNLTSVEIGASVTSIDIRPFYGCSSLTNIEVSEGNAAYKDIDGNLYSKDGKTLIQYAIGKNATEFVIPDSVTSIGNYAFQGCDSLTSVVIPDSVISIGESAFSYCSSLASIVIGDSVTSIGKGAFVKCKSLTSVEIPDSVTSIGERAFYGCISLTSVYYKGTSNDWLKILIDRENTNLTNATIYYYSETQPTVEGNFWHYVDGVPTAW